MISCGPAAGSAPAALAPASVAIPPAPPDAPVHAGGEPDGPPVDPSAPLTLPAAAMPPAPWLEPPLGEQERAWAERNLFSDHREVALGARVAVFAAPGDAGGAVGGAAGGAAPGAAAAGAAGAPGAAGAAGAPAVGPFAVHADLGVIGPLKLPAGFTWVGLAGERDDALYVATPDGALHRAADVRAALRPDGFEPRGSVPGATVWDASGGLIAAAAGERVSVSSDEGRTFTSAVVAPGKAVRAVFVRPDGALVARVSAAGAPSRGRPAPPGRAAPPASPAPPGRPPPPASPAAADTFVSSDRGQTWSRSTFQPRAVERAGSWIWNGDPVCPAVLSRDGRTWTRAASVDLLYDHATFGGALYLSTAIRAREPGALRSALVPQAPAPPPSRAAAVGREPPCKDDGAAGVVNSGLMGYRADCEGALCLLEDVPPRPPPTRTRIAAFGDGRCDPARVPPGGACAAHLVRPPTFAVVDQRAAAVTPVAAPDGCAQPVALRNAAGVGVLVCRAAGGGAALFARGAAGPWRAEGAHAVPADAIEHIVAAPDGTLLLLAETPLASAPRRAPLQALVRSPLPLGAPQAWRRVVVPDGVAALPAPGGAALLASSPAASAGARLDVSLDRPDRPLLALARGIEVPNDLTDIEVQDGRVRLFMRPEPDLGLPGQRRRSPSGPRDEGWHVLTHGGALVPEPPPPETPPAGERRLGPAGR
ncbi:hypothetical protein WMF18_12425 [Sorangium sp. So ce315]|uniref:hypothetical protein n=1 Tax=Sorangium sp. So ce315 TaxID=3133299 RepID=UPI003F631EED